MFDVAPAGNVVERVFLGGDEITHVTIEIFAHWAFWAKSEDVIWAEEFWGVSIFAFCSVFAKTFFIVWTLLQLYSVLMKVLTILILATPRLIKSTNGHFRLIMLMQKLTILPLFTHFLQPMRTHNRPSFTLINYTRHL